MRIITIAVFLASVVLTVAAQQAPCQPQKHARVPALVGLTPHQARTKLIAAGWQPFQTINANKGSKDACISYGNGPIFWKAGYWEVRACSGTGMAHCTLLYKDVYGNMLEVTTQGEHFPRDKTYARVSEYRFVCGNEWYIDHDHP